MGSIDQLRKPGEKFNFENFGNKVAELGLDGRTTEERVAQFRRMSVPDVAGLIDDLNQSLLGSRETLLADYTMKVGEQPTVPIEYRYDLFEKIIEMIQQAPERINPARIGDALGLAVVMLHPFKDGNGRTARAVGYVFQNEYDTPDRTENIAFYAGSRDEMREAGIQRRPIGYVPTMLPDKDQANPTHVLEYFQEIIFGSFLFLCSLLCPCLGLPPVQGSPNSQNQSANPLFRPVVLCDKWRIRLFKSSPAKFNVGQFPDQSVFRRNAIHDCQR